MKNLIIILLAITAVGNSCSSTYSSSNKIYKQQAKAFAKELKSRPAPVDSALQPSQWAGTTNFGMRKPSYVIIHHTAQNSCEQTLTTFTLKRTEVSAHYVICRDGTVQHMLNDYLRAWHAGNARWGNLSDINSASIGIELDNNGFEPFTEAQINNLVIVLKMLKKQFSIPTANFIGHSDIAPKRKVDPSRFFPWEQLSREGFGNWYDTSKTILPADFNAIQGLRIVGYDTRDSVAAIKAFKLHFVHNDSIPVLSNGDRKIIYELYRKS